MFEGATCPSTTHSHLTTSREECRKAAVKLGFTGDSIENVDYKYNWATTRPKGKRTVIYSMGLTSVDICIC